MRQRVNAGSPWTGVATSITWRLFGDLDTVGRGNGVTCTATCDTSADGRHRLGRRLHLCGHLELPDRDCDPARGLADLQRGRGRVSMGVQS
jgi:hypothetical protein